MKTFQVSHRAALVKGELLLKPGHSVPPGNPDARAAWACETGDLVEVLQIEERQPGTVDVLLASVYGEGRRVLEQQKAGEYERLDGTKVGTGYVGREESDVADDPH